METFQQDTNDFYHAQPGLNFSRVKLALKSARNFKLERVEPSKAMDFGTVLHTKILTPKLFDDCYTAKPANRTKEQKVVFNEWKIEICKRMGIDPIIGDKDDKTIKPQTQVEFLHEMRKYGFTVIDKADLNLIYALCEAVERNAFASALIDASEKEVSVYCPVNLHEDFPVIKCRPDGVNFEQGYFFDLKSAKDASVGGFNEAIKSQHYDLQAEWYCRTLNMALEYEGEEPIDWKFYWIAAEKTGMHCVVHERTEMYKETGEAKFNKAMETIREALATDEYRGYLNGTIEPSIWYHKKWSE